MLFSVIIPTYHRAPLLNRAIGSVLSQTNGDFEVIVVDDGGSDNSGEVVRSFGDVRVRYYHKNNEERGAARNFGADQATGEYYIFLDSDDRMLPDHLEKVSQRIYLYPERPDLIFSGFIVQEPEGKTAYERVCRGIMKRELLYYGNHLGCSAVAISASVFHRHRFNADRKLAMFEDWELWLRITQESEITCIAARTIVMENHAGRSMKSTHVAEVTGKIGFLIETVSAQPKIFSGSNTARRLFLMGANSYAALQAVLAGERKTALTYLKRAFLHHPSLLFKRRFFAILKRLI
jgi:GT2 family glycosyltransferase